METRNCSFCNISFPLTEEFFASRKGVRIQRFQSACRSCQKKYRKIHYLNNKQKYIDKASTYRKKCYLWFEEYKKTLKCLICGESRHWVLDFHHKDPKEKINNIAIMVNHASQKLLMQEINKCDVLCANCHRDLHYKEKQASNA